MTPDQTIESINKLISEVPTIVPKVEEYAANQMYGMMSVRIFNDRKNKDGGSLGKYAKSKSGGIGSWALKRFNVGRPAIDRDLNFTGNLFLAFTRGLENNKWVVGFKEGLSKSLDNYSPHKKKKLKSGKPSKAKPIKYPGTVELSKKIEENLEMTIFAASPSEIDLVLKQTNTYALGQLDNLINKHLK